jgi:iron complex transport system permease protein
MTASQSHESEVNASADSISPPGIPVNRVAMLPRRGWSAARLGIVLSIAALALGVCGLAAGSTGLLFTGSADWWIVAAIRAPRTLGAFFAGGLLGLAGAIAQGVFRNPLADPSLLGSSTGATLGIVLVLVAGGAAGIPLGMASGNWLLRMGLVGAGFAGALIGVALTLVLAGGGRRPTVLLLAGVVVGVVLGAIANLMMLVSPEALRGAQVFMLGSTGFLGWHALAPLAGVLLFSLPIAVRYSRALDALVLGESTAESLGVAVPRVRLLLVALMALGTGTAVAETGLVAFVGLVAPHLVRRSVIVTHGALLMLAALAGGVLLLAADVVARSVLAPQELPVGLLTAILGGIYLLVLLHRRASDEQR